MAHRNRCTIVTLLAFASVFAGCSQPKHMADVAQSEPAMEYAGTALRAEVASLEMEAPTRGRENKSTLGQDKSLGVDLAALTQQQPDRYLIKNAVLNVEVEDARVATDTLVSVIRGAGGYVGQLNEHVNGLGARSVSMQVRVPADRFEESMQQLDPLGRILNKQISTQDVTEEFVDTDAKARNLKRTEERVLEHLSRTAKLEDILKVEQELSRYRERIEQLEGRLRFLQNRVAFSTIQITLQEKPAGGSMVPPETFSTAEVFSEATRSLVRFAQALWVRAIWLGVWGPVWLPVVLAVLYLARRRRRARRNSGAE